MGPMIEDSLFAGVLAPDENDESQSQEERGDLIDLDTPYRGELGFGRWGRYRRPHPVTGKIEEFTRCSTVANAVQSTFALDRWQRGRLIYGLARRPDLIELAQGFELDDWRSFERISERAQEAAGANIKADKGTSLHRFAEIADGGRALPRQVSEANRKDVNAYRGALETNRLIVRPELMERVVFVESLGVCGRLDRIYQINTSQSTAHGGTYGPIFVVGDLKTSQHSPLEYSAVSVAVQLAIYSRADFFEIGDGTGEWERPPISVDQNFGLVVHFPSGSAHAEVFEVDLQLGWELAGMAMRIRELNSSQGKSQLVKPYRPR
jgi:hypothetical protein